MPVETLKDVSLCLSNRVLIVSGEPLGLTSEVPHGKESAPPVDMFQNHDPVHVLRLAFITSLTPLTLMLHAVLTTL